MDTSLNDVLPRRVYVHEVAPRDGFQIEPSFIPTERKIDFIDRLSETGLAKIEITSFVSPRSVPSLRDAEAVARGIRRKPNVSYVALVPNERGCERAIACGIDEINLVLSVSETHNLANMRMTTRQSLAAFSAVMRALRGTATKVNGSIATAFGCPFEGPQSLDSVLKIAKTYLDMGMHSVTLADTTGMADPVQVAEITARARTVLGSCELTLHFHNTRGMGLANVLAGMTAGATHFEAALGGLGGCPFAPGATGNVCTEDAVHMLAACGVETGVDLDRLIEVARSLPDLVGHDVPGQIIKAGRREQLHAFESGCIVAREYTQPLTAKAAAPC